MILPDFLTHYYERERGPLLSLTGLPEADGELLLENIRRRGDVFASRRPPEYLIVRRDLEQLIRELFIARGGQPRRAKPHYFIFGECAWCEGWYRETARLRVALDRLDPLAVSFTYGDSFPAMRIPGWKTVPRAGIHAGGPPCGGSDVWAAPGVERGGQTGA